jgi:hypothetical protein
MLLHMRLRWSVNLSDYLRNVPPSGWSAAALELQQQNRERLCEYPQLRFEGE